MASKDKVPEGYVQNDAGNLVVAPGYQETSPGVSVRVPFGQDPGGNQPATPQQQPSTLGGGFDKEGYLVNPDGSRVKVNNKEVKVDVYSGPPKFVQNQSTTRAYSLWDGGLLAPGQTMQIPNEFVLSVMRLPHVIRDDMNRRSDQELKILDKDPNATP